MKSGKQNNLATYRHHAVIVARCEWQAVYAHIVNIRWNTHVRWRSSGSEKRAFFPRFAFFVSLNDRSTFGFPPVPDNFFGHIELSPCLLVPAFLWIFNGTPLEFCIVAFSPRRWHHVRQEQHTATTNLGMQRQYRNFREYGWTKCGGGTKHTPPPHLVFFFARLCDSTRRITF